MSKIDINNIAGKNHLPLPVRNRIKTRNVLYMEKTINNREVEVGRVWLL